MFMSITAKGIIAIFFVVIDPADMDYTVVILFAFIDININVQNGLCP
jgi:hypothetical protein